MIDFDEEVSKFQPSMEIDRVEDTIAEEKLRDISDIVISLARNMQEMQDAQIAVVARLCDAMFFNCGADGASWLVCVCAVVESAIGRCAEYLLEVVSDRFFFKFDGAESFDAWRVDDEGICIGHPIHFAECRCVHALVVHVAQFGCACVCIGD